MAEGKRIMIFEKIEQHLWNILLIKLPKVIYVLLPVNVVNIVQGQGQEQNLVLRQLPKTNKK